MTADLATWLVHPVTLTLGIGGLWSALVLVEMVLRALAEMGNVRFQGMLEEEAGFIPGGDGTAHLSRILDALRWFELAVVGALWFVLARLDTLELGWRWAMAIALPVVAALGARVGEHRLGEKGVMVLLKTFRPFLVPLFFLSPRASLTVTAAEDEEDEATEREIQAFIDVGQAAGILEGEEGQLVESLVDFFDTVVREVMTPRTDMVAVEATTPFETVLKDFATTYKSRIPVYDETVDRIQGVVHVKDVVAHTIEGTRPTAGEMAKPCLVVPESKALGDLLRDFQMERQQLAIVVDEYGGTAGLVTLEDVLEEIVGEIEDEHDQKEPPEFEPLESGAYRFQGRAPLELLEEVFGLDLDEQDVDTVGGLVFSLHGTVPEPGTVVESPEIGLRFTVETMAHRRVGSTIAERLPDVGEEEIHG